MTWREDAEALLTHAFMAGVGAAHPDGFMENETVRTALAEVISETKGRTLVLGAGKASAAMAAALEREWRALGGGLINGLVATREGYVCPTSFVDIAIGGHPTPAPKSTEIAMRMLEHARSLAENDLLIGLWSGGGSSLLACPADGISFEGFLALTKTLLASGADIHEINTVRKHLSRISGGRLAQAAAPARIFNLIIPDVVGEDEEARLSAIASGPCVPDPTSLEDAFRIVERYGLSVPLDALTETPRSWEEIGIHRRRALVMDDGKSLAAAADALKGEGFEILHEENNVTGEAREIAHAHAAMAMAAYKSGKRLAIVTGGELTVTVKGSGKGGPNQEYALALALALDGAAGIIALAGDTDGIDGMGSAAGALVLPDTLARMRAAGIDPQSALNTNDSGSAFAAIGDLLITGPTLTNLNDLHLIVING